MGRGLSKQHYRIIELLKRHGDNARNNGKTPVWMETQEIIRTLRPEVEAYLAEERRWTRFARRKGIGMPHEELHKLYLEHETKLKTLPNYHTARASISRSLRSLVKRRWVIRHYGGGRHQEHGISAVWLLKEFMTQQPQNPQ